MKRMLLALTLALLVSISLSMSLASASHTTNGGGPNKNLVSGTGKDSTRNGTDFYLHVNAQSGTGSENSRGHFVLRSVGPVLNIDVTGEVVCVGVRGNKAGLGGIVQGAEGDDSVKVVSLIVHDNGESKKATDKFSFSAFSFPGPPPPTRKCVAGSGKALLSSHLDPAASSTRVTSSYTTLRRSN